MKHYFLILPLLISFFFCSRSHAQQEWAPDSAVWNHMYFFTSMSPPFDPNRHNIETRVIGDSLYQGQNCRVLARTLFSAFGGSSPFDTLLTYQDSFKVFFWNEHFNHFSLLFDFGVQVGDTVWLEGVDTICPATPSFSIVDSVGTIVVNSDTLRYYVFENSGNPSWVQNFRNIEKIGNYLRFLPEPNCFTDMVGWTDSPLLCYSDSQLGIFSTGIAPTCNYILLGTEKDLSENKCKIFSRENEWLIESGSDHRLTEMHVFNLAGKKEFEITQNPSTQFSVPKNNLPPGIYFFRIQLNSGERYSGKLLKE